MEDFSPKKIIALCRLASGDTINDAAKAAGVSSSTIDKWKQDSEFKKQLREASAKMFDMAIAELCSGAVEAAKELKNIILDDDTPKRIKVSAIQVLLSNAAKAKEMLLEQRLERIEGILNEAIPDDN